ncbi:hypothetical protein T459_24873 [Capsicum annuum]|uniref:Uncharacterized protein n=1 Tax=Capsicum annuum TaxID=4072 RepID=A0A2G2YJ65_CAPAN|nr:hypothetical protein T459_24873 [Capsicum annuum]
MADPVWDVAFLQDAVNELRNQVVKQLLVAGPNGKYILLEDDSGIRTLQSILSRQFKVLQLFVVDEGEASVVTPNIFLVNQSILNKVDVEIATDVKSEEEEDNNVPLLSDYDSEELLRYVCDVGCPFECLISEDKKSQGFKIKTLNTNHTCLIPSKNRRATQDALAHYFKKKIQNDPKIKVTDMRKYLYDTFKLNVSYSTVKRVKRLVLEKLKGSYIDEFNKLEAYAQELRESNPGTDMITNISKEALDQGKRRFLRMYVCIQALKNVVDKETSRTWKWFAELLRSSLDLADGEGLTFMSDMQKKYIKWLVDQSIKEKEKRLSLGKGGGMASFKKRTENDMWTLWCNKPQSKKMSFVADTDGEKAEEDEQPTIQPKRISKAKTRLKAKKVSHRPTGTRKISFKGDENGVSIPTNIPYSPKKLTYKGNTAITSNQLNVEKKKK